MNMRRNIVFLRRLSLRLAIVFFLVNTYAVTARAISPEITVQNNAAIDTGITFGDDGLIEITDVPVKTVVYNLQITDLEEPVAGLKLDTRAKVVSDDGYFWEIPVIWVDETGNISYICIPGKNYRPIFAYFIPANVVVANNIESDTYNIKLPEFLDGIISNSNVLMVGSQAYGITFITTGDIADLITSASGTSGNMTDLSSLLVSNDDIVGFFTGDNNKILNKLNSNVDQPIIFDSSESQSEEQPENGNNNNSVRPIKDYVSIHCTENAIQNIGKDKLQSLLDLIINVIEPQAVYQLNKGFPSFAAASKGKLLGDEIGLYVYDSEFDKKSEDIDTVVAYVSGKYLDETNTEYGYYIGINIDELYKKDEMSGEYKLIESELVTLNNTLVHELMHAYMDDFNRTGMNGVVPAESDVSSKENRFPNWFIEGAATCVENAYTYHEKIFDAMLDETEELGSRYTYDSLFDYYTGYYDPIMGYASIDSENKYYEYANNTASAYVSGYLAVMYLASMANDYIKSDVDLIGYDDNGDYYYKSDALRVGLDYILKKLHDGRCLDDIIEVVSGGRYSSTEDFQDSFLTVDDEGYYDDSYEFCLGVLNYLDYATGEISQKNPGARANGSILLAFDTEQTSAIEKKLPDDIGKQENYVINDEDSYVTSTVDNDIAIESAGVKVTGKGENDQEIIDQEFIQIQIAKISDKDAEVIDTSNDTALNEADAKDLLPEAVKDENTDEIASAIEETGTEESVADDVLTDEISDLDGSEGIEAEKSKLDDTEDIKAEKSELIDIENIVTEESKSNDTEDIDFEESCVVGIENIDAEEPENIDVSKSEVKIQDIDTNNVNEDIYAESKELELLPSLIDTTTEVKDVIEDPGIPQEVLEAISEAVAPPAPNNGDDDSESDNNDDDDGNSDDGTGDSGNDVAVSDGNADGTQTLTAEETG